VKASCLDSSSEAYSATRLWRRLGEEWVRLGDAEEARYYAHQLAPAVTAVMSAYIRALAYPPDFLSRPPDKRDDFAHNFRYAVSDMLESVSFVLGGTATASLVGGAIFEEARRWLDAGGDTSRGWQPLEAAMYALRAVGQLVETNTALLTAVFELFGTLPPVPELLTTTFRLISRFAAFTAAVPDRLAAAVEYATVVGCAGSPASGAPPAGLPIASPVQELAALSLQTLASYALPAARALYLALPPRLPLLALQHANAVRLLECCAQAVALSAAGEHEAPLAAVLAPYVGRLDALARDPASGVAAAGADGSLLAICTAKDGLIEHANAVDTGLNVAGLELLVTAAVAGGGAIDWHPDVLPLDRVSATLARNALDGIAEALYACRVQSPSVLAAALGAGPADRLPLPPGHPVAAAMAAAEASLANAIASAVAHLWPTLSAVAVTFAGNRDVLTKVARLLNFSIRSAGAAAFPPLLPSVIDAVVGIDASLQGDAELCYLARLITTKYRDLPDLRLPLLTMVRMFCNCVAATY